MTLPTSERGFESVLMENSSGSAGPPPPYPPLHRRCPMQAIPPPPSSFSCFFEYALMQTCGLELYSFSFTSLFIIVHFLLTVSLDSSLCSPLGAMSFPYCFDSAILDYLLVSPVFLFQLQILELQPELADVYSPMY